MLKELQLHGVGPVADLHARFTKRLNVLTGDNGLGKSFLLDVAWWALTGTWAAGRIALPNRGFKKPSITYHLSGKSKTQEPKKVPFDSQRQSWIRPAGRPTIPGLVIYGRVDGRREVKKGDAGRLSVSASRRSLQPPFRRLPPRWPHPRRPLQKRAGLE